jgi:hypothetical protein
VSAPAPEAPPRGDVATTQSRRSAAEGEGFEPSTGVNLLRFSRRSEVAQSRPGQLVTTRLTCGFVKIECRGVRRCPRSFARRCERDVSALSPRCRRDTTGYGWRRPGGTTVADHGCAWTVPP